MTADLRISTGSIPAPTAAGAAEDAVTAAREAGIEIRELDSLTEFGDAVALFARIWGRLDNPPLTVELVRAFSKAGNYVVGAYQAGELVGATVGFFEPPTTRALHSHITAVVPSLAGRSAGRALKLHQRAWSLERGVTTINWTFDPLVRRNAYFNLVKLAARPAEYLTNFYGAMADQINGGDQTDRLLLHWDLLDPAVAAAARGSFAEVRAAEVVAARADVVLGISHDGAPLAVGDRQSGGLAVVAVPADIEAMRTTDPALAVRWRAALREALVPLLAAGGRITGFDRDGWYVVTRSADRG